MNMEFKRKMPTPQAIKEMYPITPELAERKKITDVALRKIFTGEDDRLLLVIGPCSADREDSVLDYISRLRTVQEKVADKILIVPRVYTNKPRTTGDGYKGMLHQPDPNSSPDMLRGLIAIRKMHMKVIAETGFSCADEMLYPENHHYLSDMLSYVAVGARSEVQSKGNPLAHAILRGSSNKYGRTIPNYHYEDIKILCELYAKSGLKNPAVVIDTNHSNSGKQWDEQPRIAKEILHSTRHSDDILHLVKGLMIESYIEDGNQKPDGGVYGKSITDACIGWDKTERLIYELADLR